MGLRDEPLRPKQLSLILPEWGLTPAPKSRPHSDQPAWAAPHSPSLGNCPRGAACTQHHRQAWPHVKDDTHPGSIPHACSITAKARAWERSRKSEERLENNPSLPNTAAALGDAAENRGQQDVERHPQQQMQRPLAKKGRQQPACVQHVRLLAKSSWTNCHGPQDRGGHTPPPSATPLRAGRTAAGTAQMGLAQVKETQVN